jgi:hypothetical protein
MSLAQQFGSDKQLRVLRRLLIGSAALVAVLIARNILPEFPKSPSIQCVVSIIAHHDQRPRFDHHGPEWSAVSQISAIFPSVAEPVTAALHPQLLSTVQTKGFHYNRPPPAC